MCIFGQSFEPSDYILLGEATLLATGSVAALALLVRQILYGGYAGDLSPEEAYKKLVSDSSTVLVDLRTEGDRLESGVPDIRRNKIRLARSRVIWIEPCEITGIQRQGLRNPGNVLSALDAAKIGGIGAQNLIIMNRNGAGAKDLAKKVSRQWNLSCFQLVGGYTRWKREEKWKEYTGQESLQEILKEDIQETVTEAKQKVFTAYKSSTFEGLSLYAILAILGGVSLLNLGDTLKIVGLLSATRTGVDFFLKLAFSDRSASTPREPAFAYSRASGGKSPSTVIEDLGEEAEVAYNKSVDTATVETETASVAVDPEARTESDAVDSDTQAVPIPAEEEPAKVDATDSKPKEAKVDAAYSKSEEVKVDAAYSKSEEAKVDETDSISEKVKANSDSEKSSETPPKKDTPTQKKDAPAQKNPLLTEEKGFDL